MRRKRKKVFDITEATLDRALSKAEEFVDTGNDVYITTDENEKIKLTVTKKKRIEKIRMTPRRLRRSLYR